MNTFRKLPIFAGIAIWFAWTGIGNSVAETTPVSIKTLTDLRGVSLEKPLKKSDLEEYFQAARQMQNMKPLEIEALFKDYFRDATREHEAHGFREKEDPRVFIWTRIGLLLLIAYAIEEKPETRPWFCGTSGEGKTAMSPFEIQDKALVMISGIEGYRVTSSGPSSGWISLAMRVVGECPKRDLERLKVGATSRSAR